MMRLRRRNLVGQIALLVLAALVAGQIVAALIAAYQREAAVRRIVEADFINRANALAEVLENAPREVRPTLLLAGSTGSARFWLSQTEPPAEAQVWLRTAQDWLATPVGDLLRLEGALPAAAAPAFSSSGWRAFAAEAALSEARALHFSGDDGMGVVGRLRDGLWLNAAYHKPAPDRMFDLQALLSVAITAIGLSLIGVAIARKITRPLQQLTASAEAMGRGQTLTLAPPEGPEDVRQLYVAFNQMQERLHRFLADRTRMLASVGHDLRTPLTILRLRAELIADPDLQAKIFETLDEMRAITEASLSFARDEAAREESRTVDLTALVGSLCDDFIEMGHDVAFPEADRIVYRCRPDGLRRALRNLIDNALRYAGHARVSIRRAPGAIEVAVEDSGEGVPAEEMERVFEPFHRLEASRNRATGGVGLGLSIARAVARQHGGDVALRPGEPGLRVLLTLPEA